MFRLDRRWAVAMALGVALTGTRAASGAVIRVGPGGDHATVQAAIDAAAATPEADQLRIRAGTYNERLVLFGGNTGGGLELSGGWDAAFANRNPDPAVTTIDAQGLGRVFDAAHIVGGGLTLRGLTLRNGLVDSFGAGIFLFSGGPAVLIDRCQLLDNRVQSADASTGAPAGGLRLGVYGSAVATIVDTRIEGNAAELGPATGSARGGGGYLSAEGTAVLRVRRTTVSANTLAGGSQQRGAGLFVTSAESGRVVLEDNVFSGNHGTAVVDGAAFESQPQGDSRLTARRLDVRSNRSGLGDSSSQIKLRSFDTAVIRFSDLLIARGGTGIDVETYTGGTIRIVNATVTEHVGQGIYLYSTAPGAGSVANSIAWSNDGGDLALLGNAAGQANLVGVDPLFVDPAGGNYRLTAGSPALDNGAPNALGGLSPLALGHAPRTAGAAPDRGAYERRAIFGDGFEYGDASWWLVP
jgi:hypothetical protein